MAERTSRTPAVGHPAPSAHDANHVALQRDRYTSAAPSIRAAFLIAVAAALLEVSAPSAMVGGVVVVLFVVALGELER